MKEKTAWLNEPAHPVIYAQNYLLVAQERNYNQAQILRLAGLEPGFLADQNNRISPLAFRNLVSAILQVGEDDGLGFEVGARTPPTVHGSLGYALLCSSTLLEASAVLMRFRHLRGRGMRFLFTEQPDYAQVEFCEEIGIGEPPVRNVMLQGLLSGFFRAVQILLADGSKPGEIWFDQPEPEYFSRYQANLPLVHFNMPCNQVRLPRDLLERPLPMSNPSALQLGLAQCEREDRLLGFGETAILNRVREALTLGPHGYPTPEQLADTLCMSTRTFRRKLFEQGSNYKQLLEDARRRDAINLLEKNGLEVQQIAELLGYTNPANFTRAFRDWTGRPPSRYRALNKETRINY